MTSHTIELGDILAAIPGFWAAWQEHNRSSRENGETPSFRGFLMERVPNMFGIGKVDEAIYASLWMKMSDTQRRQIGQLYAAMEDYEVDCLRLVICNIQPTIEKLTKTAANGKNAAKEEVVFGKDQRLLFLRTLAKAVETAGSVDDVVADLRLNRFIVRDPASEKAYQLWLATTAWVRENVTEFFGVDNLSEITPTVVAQRVNAIALQVPYRDPSDVNIGFWRWCFTRHRVFFGLLIVVWIILGVVFYTLPSP